MSAGYHMRLYEYMVLCSGKKHYIDKVPPLKDQHMKAISTRKSRVTCICVVE